MRIAQRSNQYFICLLHTPLNPIPWDIPDADETVNCDCIYFGKVFEAMESRLQEKGITFYLTWSLDELPSYGQNVVAVVMGDEWCRIPKYFHKVRAVFKTYGIFPTLGCNPLVRPSLLNLLTLLQFWKNWFLRLPSLLHYRWQQFRQSQSNTVKLPRIYDIPLGYFNQLDLPIKDLEARSYDVFFAGSVAFKAYPVWSIRHWLQTPKILARKKMVSSVYKIQEKYPQLQLELSLTPSFGYQGERNIAAKAYSEQLMDAKICLVPRGSSFETFRFFEGLRYGCIVISEKLPSRWFYVNSPAIQIEDWSQLEEIVDNLFKNSDLMQKLHEESLSWWQNKCSETAVGSYIAEKLNQMNTI
jgi:hypothetical protein